MMDQAEPTAPPTGRLTRVLREVGETLLLSFLIFLAVRFVVQNFRVEGFSMEPNLRPGQYLLVNKAIYFAIDGALVNHLLPGDPLADRPYYLFHQPQRGEIVIFHFPTDPRRDFVKRIAGLPGETVEIRQGVLYINGNPIAEPYLTNNGTSSFPPTTVPEGHYFVLGDNRSNSSDSRTWGVVPWRNIVGQAWLIYWPPGMLGWAPNYPMGAAASGP